MSSLPQHARSFKNRDALLAVSRCGCVYCGGFFAPTAIARWVDGGQTAACPGCGTDAVLPDAPEYPLTSASLSALHQSWFAASERREEALVGA